MLRDARSVPDGGLVEADVCVIGAGPAGMTIAGQLAGCSVRVCLLEAGGPALSRASRALADGENVGQPYALDDMRARALAGTSHLWDPRPGLRCRPLEPLDFSSRPGLTWSGWPFDHTYLDPYYRRAQQLCGLGPYRYDAAEWHLPDAWPRRPAPDPVVDTYVTMFGPTDRFCRYQEEVCAADNIDVLLHANVVELALADNGAEIVAARVAHRDGRGFRVAARLYVLAGGGIENARLLLLSSDRRPAGLGNEHDLVGRFFMEHPHVQTGVIHTVPGALGDLRFYRDWDVEGVRVRGMLGLRDEVLRREGLLNNVFFVSARLPSLVSDTGRSLYALRKATRLRRWPQHPGGHARNLLLRPSQLAAAAADRLDPRRRAAERTSFQLTTMSEQEPNPASRVTLGRRRDAFGQPQPRLDWKFTERDRASIRRAQELIDQRLRQTGLGTLTQFLGEEGPPAEIGGGGHHMGTTRMHDDPRRGVVDRHGKVHSVANLYLAGSSVFPTVGWANPTLTVVALAARLADEVTSVLERRELAS